MEPGALWCTIILAGLIIAWWWVLKKLAAILFRRALRQVIGMFRVHGAVMPENAKSLQELGLGHLGLLVRIGRTRDYHLHALDLLIRAGAIVQTYDKKAFLSERGLRAVCESDRENRLGLHQIPSLSLEEHRGL